MAIPSVSGSGSSYYSDWMARLEQQEAAAEAGSKSEAAEKFSSEEISLSRAEIASLASNARFGHVESLLGSLGGFSPADKKEPAGLSALYDSFSTLDLMRSGTFSKLAKSYFASMENDVEDAEKAGRAAESSAALRRSAAAVSDRELFAADGNGEYDREAISSAVKGFAESYNKALDDISDTSSLRTLQKGVSMVGMTSAVSGMLSRVGISIGEDNLLSVDEEKLAQAEISDLRALFEGGGSYASVIGQKAAMVANNADVSGYDVNGSYNYTAYTSGIVSVQV